MRTPLIAVFCLLIPFVGATQSRSSVSDSLARELQTHTAQDTQRVYMLIALARNYISVDNDQTFKYGKEALELSASLNFETGQLKAHNTIALANLMAAEFKIGVDHALQALALAEKLGNIVEKGESCRTLATIYVNMEDYEKSRSYYKKALSAALASGDMTLLTKSTCSYGMLFYRMDMIDSANFYLKKSLVMAEEYKVDFFKPHILGQMGWVNRTSDLTTAIAYEHKALEAARKVENNAAHLNALTDLGNMYIMRKDYVHAEQYLTEALRMSRFYNAPLPRPLIYEGLIDLKIAQGKNSEIKLYVDAYMDSWDSIFSQEKTKQFAELETRFNVEKNEQTIKILEQEKRMETLWRNASIIGALVLLTLSTVIFRLQRLRNKKARQLLDTQKELNEKLQESDALRSRFFATISHEFRTPIALILAPLEEKIKSPTLTLRDKEDLKLVMRNANRLAELVNQVLDLSKLEAGKMDVQQQNGSINTFLTPLLSSFHSLAQSRKIVFTHASSVPEALYAFDPDKLEKIISNLLSNAFKFTPANGEVSVTIQASESSNLSICIADTGKGISVEDMPHIFSPFYQSGTTENTDLPGTGLGLALVHEMVNMLGGTISVVSNVNEGTTVNVSLPLRASAPGSIDEIRPLAVIVPDQMAADILSEPATTETFAETLLIVEDNQELRHFISNYFSKSFNVCTATNGREAVEIALERIPSLIISDVMMPEMDGVEFLKHVRQDERTNHIPVILLTAKAAQEEKIAALRLGTDEYLAKPFSVLELEVRVRNIIDNRKKLAAHYKRTFKLVPYVESTSQLPVPPSINEKFIEKIISCIHRNLGDASFGVETLAEEMCLSRTQLFRKVKMILDTSPSDLISDLRLQHAAKMIEHKSDTLAQIAYAVGFTEQSYFAKRFRKKYGVSPREYSERMSA